MLFRIRHKPSSIIHFRVARRAQKIKFVAAKGTWGNEGLAAPQKLINSLPGDYGSRVKRFVIEIIYLSSPSSLKTFSSLVNTTLSLMVSHLDLK